MGSTITIRDIDPKDKSWLERQARHLGVSLEEFVRGLIREKRMRAERRMTPSEIFARHFGSKHGVELPLPARHSYNRIEFMDESGT